MKKKISVALAIMLSFACLPFNTQASAEEFTYLSWCDKFDFENYKANGVVSGIFYNEEGKVVYYTVKPLTYESGFGEDDGRMCSLKFDNVEGEKELKIGDLFYITSDWVRTVDVSPPIFEVMDHYMGMGEEAPDLEIKYIGNGIELWGDEFRKSLRNAVNLWAFAASDFLKCEHLSLDLSDLNVVKGDATEDEEVDIVDVVAVNRAVLGKQVMQSYAQYVSDINGNGIIEPSDALEIMKYVVGLTDTLDAE